MRLSVIIPTHNRWSLLQEAICSVINQKTSVEVVICDDGSTDETSKLSGIASANGSLVILSRTEERFGAQVARNRGLTQAKSEAVLFMDSDDVLTDVGLMPLLRAMEEDSSLDYVFGRVIRTDEKLEPLAGIPPVGRPFAQSPVEMAGYHWHTMGAVYRRSYLEKVGPWNEALTGSQDWEYQARVKLAGGHGEFIDSVVGFWRHHGGARVGTNTFRPDYVHSVMMACDSILQQARKVQRCDRALERRLAKKLIVHALEWGANGHAGERRQCLLQTSRTLPNDRLYQALVRCIQLSPVFLDSWLWKALTTQASKQSG